MAHPGTLPVVNREAIRHVLRVGLAIGGSLADYTEFDRKNYFYPDLPKGYQISQYEHPLVEGGELAGVLITRIHLEEDTARSQHDPKSGATLIDFNRAGVPLMELVTEPVIRSAEQAGNFARELQLVLRYLGASHANMEKGEMRVEANISVAPKGSRGTKVEVKNLNSFRSMERAVAYEIKRQSALIEKGGQVVQETRGWDEGRQETFAQRVKEGSADYRYFPDPDIPKFVRSELPELSRDVLTQSLGELPWARRARYLAQGLKHEDVETLVRERVYGDFFDRVVAEGAEAQLAANYITSDLFSIFRDIDGRAYKIKNISNVEPKEFAALMGLITDKTLSSRGAKDVLRRMVETGEDALGAVEALGVRQQDDPALLAKIVDQIMEENPTVVADVRAGNEKALQFFVGQGMKLSKGAANPQALLEVAREKVLNGV